MAHLLGFQQLPGDLESKLHLMVHDSGQCRLSGWEFPAVELAYAAGLRPGDRRQDFINAGLIEP